MDDVVIGTAADEDLHESDFYTWAWRQAALIRDGRLSEADLSNLFEEVESLGRSEYYALRSSYRLIASHLLKLRFQASKSSRSWRSTIVHERNNVDDRLRAHPRTSVSG